MKKDILKLYYLPIIGWIIVSILYFCMVYFFINNHVKQHIKHIEQLLINEKKQEIKKEAERFKILFLHIQHSVYSYTEDVLNEFINLPIKSGINKIISTNTVIVGLIPDNKKFKYEIYKNRFVILNYHKKKYIVVLKNKGKKIYIMGVRKAFVDDFILNSIKEYLDKINNNKIEYIALGKILTLNPGKNGIFGYLYYMPLPLKDLEGLILSVKKPDMKGNFFRSKYLECFRKNRGCYVSYYWKNPLTKQIEKKVSYFLFLKEYNLSVIKGFYESQIIDQLKRRIKKYKSETFNIFKITVAIYFVILITFLIIQNFVFKKLRNKLIENYEALKNNLISSFYFDNLTALPNRNKLIEDVKNYESLILIDIDDFSDINDIYGFDVGDSILKEIAKILKEKYQNVYRVGSDEFAIGFFKKLSINEVKQLAQRQLKVKDLNIDLILGASNYKERLYESAEMALKIAFNQKDKKYVLYDEEIYFKQREKLNKINKLKEVLAKRDVIPFYQCIVDREGNITKYEALMRLKIDNKIESPFFFMDLIKESRLYSYFSKIMIEKVFDDLDKISAKVSINLSYEDIDNKEMREFIFSLLNVQNASKVVFEILESESIQNYDVVRNFISKVKEKGAEIAIDDFGRGYSNFVQVLNLEPDIIKIDASLIKNIKEKKNYKMVELIINFAKSFNLKTVAEFVSDKEIFEMVKNLGIDEFQGFYFCKPLPFDKISAKKGTNEN